ncbi:homoserine kinase [Buchnera aphidicola (Kurisakia onigurumii)]|uniref:homoserine kinase n=1 Tax=Buchnera aphidicola TaxID=9 RepID=UPI0031B6AA3C
MIKIYAPASIGNLNVGFDVLGAAISPIDGSLLGDCITIQSSKKFELKVLGSFKNDLPKNELDNIVWKCWNYFCKKINKKINIKITLEKNMPIGSGLGSSACSIVAALIAINNFLKKPLQNSELLILMGKLEGIISGEIHYDNVAPCYLGGLQLIINQKKYLSEKIPNFTNWLWIVGWPGIKISTSQARNILPKKYSKETCIQHSKNLAGFIHASYTKNSKLASTLMQDLIAEPYRTCLLPNFIKTKKKIIEVGALSCGISGSGPSIFAITKNTDMAVKISEIIKNNYFKNKIDGFVKICKIDTIGAREIG